MSSSTSGNFLGDFASGWLKEGWNQFPDHLNNFQDIMFPFSSTFLFNWNDSDMFAEQEISGDENYGKWGLVGTQFLVGLFSGKPLASAKTAPKLDASTLRKFVNGEATPVVLEKELTLFRLHGGKAQAAGNWFTNVAYTSRRTARENLAILQEWGNKLTKISTIVIPKGTTIWVGYAAPQVGKNGKTLQGGGMQIYIEQGRKSREWVKETNWLRTGSD